jgi:hypothetical protein
MKKYAFFSLITMGCLFAIIFLFSPQAVIGSKKPIPAGQEKALPDSVLKFVQKTCMDCHADDGNFMAKGKVNFSEFENYSPEKQASKAKAICKVLTKGSMPPGKWLKNNADKAPAQTDIDMICRWANGLQK